MPSGSKLYKALGIGVSKPVTPKAAPAPEPTIEEVIADAEPTPKKRSRKAKSDE